LNQKNYNPDIVAFYDIQSGTERGYSEGKDTGKVNKKGKYKKVKYKQEKRKQVTGSKRKQVIRETHI